MILCDMVSKEASTKQLLLRPFLGGNCFSVHPYKSCSAHVCWTAQRSLQKAVILVLPNSIYPIQIAANPSLSFGTVLRVRPEQSQGNNVKFFKSLFWQTLSGQHKTYYFSLDIQWNTALIVLVLFQIHRRGMEFLWPLYVWVWIFSGFLHLLQLYLTKLCPFLLFTCKSLQDLSQVALSRVRNMNSLIRGTAEAILLFLSRNRVSSRINKGLFSHPPMITSSNKDQV